MSLSNFALSKSWENAEDFPTFEENEEQVRADMQCLFDELAAGLRRLINELQKKNTQDGTSGAKGVGVDYIDGLSGATNVQDALALLKNAVDEATTGTLPDSSVTTDKLAALAVTAAKLAVAAVTTEKLADGAVTGAKTNFSSGLTVGGALTQNGPLNINNKIILDSDSYGDELPATAEAGRLFFLKVTE